MDLPPTLQWQVEETIDASLDQSWAAFEDLSLIPKYHPAVGSVEFPSDAVRRAPGVEYKCIIPAGPQRGWCVEKVIEHVPRERSTIAFTGDSWGLSERLTGFVTEVVFEACRDAQTRVTLRGFYSPKGLCARMLNALFIRRAMRRRAKDTLAGMKQMLEAGASPSAMATSPGSAPPEHG
jgi:uncharacterized membrane protein